MTQTAQSIRFEQLGPVLDRFLDSKSPEMIAAVADYIQPLIEIPTLHGALKFSCPNRLTLWRAQTLLSKEPETIEWIDSFEEGDHFWDVGANVGVYSLYAALLGRVKTLAFEPSAANYFVLNRNIRINHYADRISALCLAIGDCTRFSGLHMGPESEEAGGALNQFGEAFEHDGNPFKASFTQGMLGFSLDTLLSTFDFPFPTHIKIDVDGIEDKVIEGASETLADPRLRSILVELNVDRTGYYQSVVAKIERAGFKLDSKRHGPMFDESDFSSFYNHIFVKA